MRFFRFSLSNRRRVSSVPTLVKQEDETKAVFLSETVVDFNKPIVTIASKPTTIPPSTPTNATTTTTPETTFSPTTATTMETTTETTETETQSLTKKSVTFATDLNQIKEIETRGELLEEIIDISTLWYSRSEYCKIRIENRDVIHRLDYGFPLLKNKDQCARGLEHMTALGKRQYARNKAAGQEAVFEEQYLQRCIEGINSPQLVAKAYEKKVSRCQAAAYARGLNDGKHLEGKRNVSFFSSFRFNRRK